MAATVLAIGWVVAHQMSLPVWWPFAGDSKSVLEPSKDDLTAAARNAVLKEPAAAVQRKKEEAVRKRDPIAALAPGSGRSARHRLTDGSPCPFCPEMVAVPAGRFIMGSAIEAARYSDEAQEPISIGAAFAVGRFAVTFDEWDACVADGACNGYKPGDEGWGQGMHPVINVNWIDAKMYASAWFSRKTGKSYRLLSEAEREYVTWVGTTTPFWWGSSISPAEANYNGSAEPYKGFGSKREYRRHTVPVDSFQPNPWGLYNVHGNVWEWTEDCWNDSNRGIPSDGSARTKGYDCSRRVVRGGCWNLDPEFLRSAYRSADSAVGRRHNVGFRVARTLP